MASSAEPQNLPILYRDLVPLSKNDHAAAKMTPMGDARLIAETHALPLTTDEFVMAQRFYPIVFTTGPDTVPLALMGLNEGVNVFVDEAGQIAPNIYLPAYLRRYPFLLARLQPEGDEMSLCFDPSSGMVGDTEEGLALFADGEPSQVVTDVLAFAEQFEVAGQRTQQFTTELNALGLLEDGEVTIRHDQLKQPYTYRGFRMVSEEKLRDLRGDQLRKISQNGMLPLLYAHLFSLNLMSEIFSRQMEQGKVPPQIDLNL